LDASNRRLYFGSFPRASYAVASWLLLSRRKLMG
jgi:hypothetical protein